MNQTNIVYQKRTDMSVELRAQERCDMVVMRGKAVLNEQEKRFTFLQNPPRSPRSVEMGRTIHARLVRTHQGRYTLTFRFDGTEQRLKQLLTAELGNVLKNIKK